MRPQDSSTQRRVALPSEVDLNASLSTVFDRAEDEEEDEEEDVDDEDVLLPGAADLQSEIVP